ncbi:ERI2 [Lepeophtheirus salmonis]|uniref:ERI2 n=1 Tax=Lepeophtheirus salmonis TaxID=72036 RepID=A0A7R8HD37_LEPSM|nr:ERI2 [Lepeophtheirus salmonis]CAF3018753.1 ERI2 [Lepeophtheirus salmonis]
MSTKALAQKLGKIRTRYFDSSSSSSSLSTNKGGQSFKYLFILDFESTCWEIRGFAAPEIIEFPVVLLEVSTGRILSEFRTYVCPVEHPSLSTFCTKLTGITQDVVDNEGVPLGTALLLFKKMDIFPPDAIRYIISSSREAFSYVSHLVKLGFRSLFGGPEGLNGALKDVGLSFDGREHSGLDDAKNTARLVAKMVKDGCLLGITKSLPGVTVPEIYKAPSELMYGNNKIIKKLKLSSKKSIRKCSINHALPKKTPPLCSCGRRTKYLTVSKVGPNHGRSFFACVLKSCGFFSWDQETVSARSPAYEVKIPISNDKENKISFVNKNIMSKTMINTNLPEPQQYINTNFNKISRKLHDVTNNYFGNVPIHPITTVVNRTLKRTLGIKRRSY